MKIDPDRLHFKETGILVRAQDQEGKWQNVDIAWLDLPSLKEWLRSRGGRNQWAENTVAILLGHLPP